MKKIGILLTFTISLLICTISFGQEQAPAPVIKDGTFWQFRATRENWYQSTSTALAGDYEVLYQNSQLKVFKLDGASREEITGVGADELKRMISLGQDQRKYFDLPLFEGKKRSASYTESGSPSARTNVTYEVKGIEDVSTPGGNFRTFRIEGGARTSVTGNNYSFMVDRKYLQFYNTDVQSIVKFHFETKSASGADSPSIREIELIKFGPARQ